MSFILDALKKSESDRQRQSGPGLYEVKVAAPRSQLPHWAIGLIVLLGINLLVVAWALLKRPAHEAGAPATAAVAAPPGSAPSQAPAATPPPAVVTAAPATTPGPLAQAATAPVTSPASPARVTGASEPQDADSALPGNAAAAALSAAQEGSGESAGNPDDYAPAAEPTQGPGFKLHVRRGVEEGVPLYSQVATDPGSNVPELRLDLHAYAPNPNDRFAMINMKKVREGDSLPQGVKVERITPDGVILSHNGSRFMLPRE